MSDLSTLHNDGFVLIDRVISTDQILALIDAIDSIRHGPFRRVRAGRMYAMRNLRALPAVRDLCQSPSIRALIEPVLGPAARAVRGLLFDKTAGANWKVAWHQDRSIAVAERIGVPGYGPWSTKAGVVHVQPPVRVLQGMLTLRLSLDPCGPDNGPLRVLPGSHAHGFLSEQQIQALRAQAQPATCTLAAGGVMLMRPLLLHASSVATSPDHRRVIHLEFAAGELPGGVQWCEQELPC